MTAPFAQMVTPTGVLVMDAETMAADHAAWLAARRWRAPDHLAIPNREAMFINLPLAERVAHGYRIGSSEVPSILDLDGVDTPAHVYRNKVMGVSGPVNEAMTWGHIFEPAIAQEWQRRNRSAVDEIGLIAHVSKPWHQSTIDRRVLVCPLGIAGGCGLEVKNVGYSSSSRWKRDLPDRILAQIVHQLFVTGYGHMHYACNVGGNTMRQGVVYAEREAELMAYIVAEVDRFRDEHLLTGVEPEWDVAGKAGKLIALDQATHPTRVGELAIDEIGDVMAYAQAAAEEGAARKRKERHKARLAQLADGAELVLFSDRPAYGYRPTTRTYVSIDALMERHPEAYADPEVVKETTSSTIYIDRAYQIKIRDEEA